MRTQNRDLNGIGSIGLLVLFCVLSVLLCAGIPSVYANGDFKLSDWIGFSGSIVNTVGAVAVGYVAYRAIMKQINVQRELDKRREAEAEALIWTLLEDLFKGVEVSWWLIDRALEHGITDALHRWRLNQAFGYLPYFVPQYDVGRIRELSKHLSPAKEFQVIAMLHNIDGVNFERAHQIYTDSLDPNKIFDIKVGAGALVLLRLGFTYAVGEIKKADPSLAKMFDERSQPVKSYSADEKIAEMRGVILQGEETYFKNYTET